MKLATTTGEFIEYKSCPKEAVRQFKGTKFKYLDLNFCESVYEGSPFIAENWKDMIKETQEEANELGMTFVQAHSPDGGAAPLLDTLEGEDFVRYTIRSIEACAILGIKNIVVHSGAYRYMSSKEFFDKNLAFYRKLFPVMEQTGVNVLVENGCYEWGYTRTGKEIKEFLEYAKHPLLHACWDTGHANIVTKDQYTSIMDLGEDLYALHIHDNNGIDDLHSVPYTGTCSFDAIMTGLMDIGYKGYFTFESTRLLIPGRLRNSWSHNGEDVSKIQNPTGVLRQEAVKFEYEIGKYILTQYNCFEE